MTTKEWEIWPEEIHQDSEQLKRQESARKAETTPKDIRENYAIFKGSKKDYITTLAGCTCVDFNRRKKPCKHMYRLAFEVGAFSLESVDVDESINTELRIGDAMKIIEKLPDSLQEKFMRIIYDVHYGKGYSIINQSDVEPLLQVNLIKDYQDKNTVLNKLKKEDLLRLAPEANRKLKKPELIDYIINNIDLDYTMVLDNKRMITLDDSIKKIDLAMYRKLYDKFRPEEIEFEYS